MRAFRHAGEKCLYQAFIQAMNIGPLERARAFLRTGVRPVGNEHALRCLLVARALSGTNSRPTWDPGGP
jgi:hypothetical protein